VAVLAFLLLVAGGLVTSNNAGLSVPDWPTSFGHLFKIPKMIGGVKFEHTHRMVAEFVGLLTIIVAFWTWRVDQRRWMRGLTLGAVAGVVFQGILGGLTVLNYLPPAISTAHATVGQTMFCVLTAIAVFTSRSWVQEPAEKIAPKDARPQPIDRTIVIQIAWLVENQPPSLKINEESVNWENLHDRLSDIFKGRMERVAFVKGDGEVDFEYVADAIAIARNSGVQRVGLMTMGGAETP